MVEQEDLVVEQEPKDRLDQLHKFQLQHKQQ
jgi:hypothetical protein